MWQRNEGPPEEANKPRLLTGETGSLRYMAPEVALSKPYSHRAEVFAYATIVWQMLAHERPFSDCDVEAFYKRVCHRGERPRIPHGTPPQLQSILVRCWDVDPAKRPEMSEVISVLDKMICDL